VEATLFARNTLLRRWGRIGSTGRQCLESFDSRDSPGLDFAVICPLVRRVGLISGSWSIGSRLCSTVPSDSASRRRPCASLALRRHQAGQRTLTSTLPILLGTQKGGRPGAALSLGRKRPRRAYTGVNPHRNNLMLRCNNCKHVSAWTVGPIEDFAHRAVSSTALGLGSSNRATRLRAPCQFVARSRPIKRGFGNRGGACARAMC
jgi:hypothetical protein